MGTHFPQGNRTRVVQRSPKPSMWVRILLPLQNIKGYDLVNVINYLKESYVELTQKVTWPTWEKLQSSALLVLVTTLILAVVIFLIDFAFQHLMEFIYAL